jgi:hypothetical protein
VVLRITEKGRYEIEIQSEIIDFSGLNFNFQGVGRNEIFEFIMR